MKSLTEKVKHTPTPWALDSLDGPNTLLAYRTSGESFTMAVLSELSSEDASFIVRACNSHYDLLKALRLMIHDPKEYMQWAKEVISKLDE